MKTFEVEKFYNFLVIAMWTAPYTQLWVCVVFACSPGSVLYKLLHTYIHLRCIRIIQCSCPCHPVLSLQVSASLCGLAVSSRAIHCSRTWSAGRYQGRPLERSLKARGTHDCWGSQGHRQWCHTRNNITLYEEVLVSSLNLTFKRLS